MTKIEHPLAGYEFTLPVPKKAVRARLHRLFSKTKRRKNRFSGELVEDEFRLFRFTGILYPYTPLFTGKLLQAEDDPKSTVVRLNVVPAWLGHGSMGLLLVIYLLSVSPGTVQGALFGVLLILLLAGLMVRLRGRQIQSVFTEFETALAESS